MKDRFDSKARVKGHLTVKARHKDTNEWFTLVDRDNALVANAPTLIANALAGNTGWFIDNIKAFKAGVLLASSTTSYSFPSLPQVKFTTLFDFSSFNDTADELRLSSVLGGDFSAVTGLSINKPNTLELSIEWVLTVI